MNKVLNDQKPILTLFQPEKKPLSNIGYCTDAIKQSSKTSFFCTKENLSVADRLGLHFIQELQLNQLKGTIASLKSFCNNDSN